MSTRKDQLSAAQAAIQSGDFARGRVLADALLETDPADGEALYMAAVAARYLGRHDDAAGYLDRLHAAMPEYGRAWQEAGHLARAQGQADTAIAAYQRATRFNPALEASWRALAELQGGAEGQAAGLQADRIAALPRELVAVTHHLHEGRLLRAEEICRHYLRANPQDTEGMRLLAQIGIKLGILDDAEFLLESAKSFAPDNIQIRLDYIDALRRRQKFGRAREEAEALYQRDPDSPVFQSHLAIESMQTGDYDRAFALFDAILKRLPHDPATLTSRGHALKTRGLQDDAIASYHAALQAKPDHGDAWYALANLKTYPFENKEIDLMRDLHAQPYLSFSDRVHLSFALGKALEDRGDYADSFDYYRQGNDLKRAQTRYSADTMSAELAMQREVCTPELFARHSGAGDPAPDPIFILGLPRAGSTLLEQILASHSQIDGTLELPNVLALAHRLRGRRAGQSRYPGYCMICLGNS